MIYRKYSWYLPKLNKLSEYEKDRSCRRHNQK